MTAGVDAAAGAGRAEPRAQRELREFVRLQEQRRRHLPRALIVGVLSGLMAVAFGRSLEISEHLRGELIEWARRFGGLGALVPVLLGSVTAAVAVGLVARIAPEASGSGIPHLKAVLHRLRGLRWRTVLPVKFVGGVLGIGGGLALGREGPTVQMGGAVGQMVGGWFRCTPRERLTLIAAGAGAGLSAAFNAPLAGLVFGFVWSASMPASSASVSPGARPSPPPFVPRRGTTSANVPDMPGSGATSPASRAWATSAAEVPSPGTARRRPPAPTASGMPYVTDRASRTIAYPCASSSQADPTRVSGRSIRCASSRRRVGRRSSGATEASQDATSTPALTSRSSQRC